MQFSPRGKDHGQASFGHDSCSACACAGRRGRRPSAIERWRVVVRLVAVVGTAIDLVLTVHRVSFRGVSLEGVSVNDYAVAHAPVEFVAARNEPSRVSEPRDDYTQWWRHAWYAEQCEPKQRDPPE